MKSTFTLLAAIALLSVNQASAEETASSTKQPNFVVILADDMGYSDLGCYGGEIETPNIDALADGGLRFRQFYNCSRCTSTRASLLTGYYPQRIGMGEFGRTMDLNVPTVAERLRDAGYRTAMAGKWHLSELPAEPKGEQRLRWMDHQAKADVPFADPASLPTRRGFDKFYGVVWGVVNHFDPFSLVDGETPVEDVPEDYHSTDAIADRTVDYIREFVSDDKPFFIYTSFTAPHWPIQARPEAIAKYHGKYDGGWDKLRADRHARQVELGLFDASAKLDGVINEGKEWEQLPAVRREYLAEKMAIHAAMIDQIDQGVGRIIDALKATGEFENTVILVMSDNGASPEIPGGPGYDRYAQTREGKPAWREADLQLPANRAKLGTEESYAGIGSQWASAVNTPLNFWKMESYEGGCRTPLVVHWPAGLQGDRGRITEEVGHVIDVAPTLLDLAGVAAMEFDGQSLAPALTAEATPSNRTLYFSHMGGRGVRSGNWKAAKLAKQDWQLFDLQADPGETTDLSEKHPQQLRRMVQQLGDWSKTSHKSPVAKGSVPVRAPSVPLIACDPYFSIWSPADELTGAATTHWTGKQQRLTSLVTIDGKPYRLMGAEPADVAALEQTNLDITPTQSKYTFSGGGVELTLTFATPALPYNIDILSRPITYVTYECRATDGKQHDVRVYFDARGEIAVNEPTQEIAGSIKDVGNLVDLSVGSVEQNVLGKSGDDLRIDWGYFHLAGPKDQIVAATQGDAPAMQREFAKTGALPSAAKPLAAQPANDAASAVTLEMKDIGAEQQQRWLILAYDDEYSIEFMHKPLRPYWRRNGLDAAGLLTEAARDRGTLLKDCDKFDQELHEDLVKAGGEDYAAIATLAYRQCFAAGKFVADANGQPIQFCKENHSNGCIATSDVFYPMAPQFLLLGPSLAKSFVVPFMEYAASDRWKFPFAPHDVGTYPKANGQVYGGGEKTEDNQMPVEESANLLLLMAAIARVDGNADFADKYWPQLEQWANYLKKEGFDPANQLCTDDFSGHLAHNVNLSAKAICGLGAYAQLCEMRGDDKQAAEFRKTAKEFAKRWIKEADDGDHYRLAFDKPGTWSQKYNLVWDRVLGLDLFPDSVRRKEMDYYLKMQNKYGLPLDNRRGYTKLDWIVWTATLTQNRDDFDALVQPVYEFLGATPNRAPMTDWYETEDAKKVGFTARPVVGGVFMPLLYDNAVWRKWADRDRTAARGYAPMPKPPKVTIQLPAADEAPVEWSYTFEEPKGEWMASDYDDSSWQRGKSGFGTKGTPGERVSTVWDKPDIWLRRTFDWNGKASDALRLHIHHDDDAEIYINGVLARRAGGFTASYQQLPISPAALQALKPTGNVIAVHCHQDRGGQYIDVGLATVEAVE